MAEASPGTARWQLVPERGGAPFVLPEQHTVVVGRATGADLWLDNDTVSRQHAELRAGDSGVLLRDLGSSNGVRVNGVKLARGQAVEDDLVVFGDVAFWVRRVPLSSPSSPSPPTPPSSPSRALARLQAERLARLVELAQALSGELSSERLLSRVVDEVADLLPADRVALLLADPSLPPDEELRPAYSRDRIGNAPVSVPRSIVQRALSEKAPVTTQRAFEDARFQSGSVVERRIGAALCVPLLADAGRVLGVLYADSLAAGRAFSEEDAALCFALGGLAAASLAKAHYAEAARREAVARANFERFFAPGVAARIAGQRSGVRPGGERRLVSVLYSDVRGFTGLAESLLPELVADQLSEYFAAMVELVFEHGGTLDKFVGDALLAVWGAPDLGPDDADRCLRAAQAMQREMLVLNSRWAEVGRPELGVGIGLHHGEAFAGTIGSPRRLEYTVIGDVVNVAARLCEVAAPGEIVLSEALRGRLTRAGPEPREPLAVRGREEPVFVYRVRGEGSREREPD